MLNIDLDTYNKENHLYIYIVILVVHQIWHREGKAHVSV